ncbi:hypothetical protein LTR99_008787 [Exophiala xenobiotica]|uniref:Transcriptional coactivator p15 (PC4) C-terminal domain-containing protein n=1 Tax=Vermiconidia calcicola TaxID=1690605 RepID=A0AAV9Q2K4_9PEZI|nr:hypothetical protein H2202_007129 [Exophiala xenobiotica]KAK5533431.1 hypothetical protein LTR25_007297 [Vermiconidia calcicola]KAK5542893.1 hypothetical protein LTR23_005218 [Chaetothyriales sp. CCFEE 6169]KAK5205883.1 hypothetical protein LTR41_008565 [Exophiala xenobiotica]KAK5225376.1 hypothetical protein LTR47_009438 [Exophiala xenobiotica]
MTSLSKKRKSSSVVRDDSDVDAAVATKRGKGASGAAFIPSNKPQTDSDGNQYWEISRGRRVTISDYKGMTLVNIREYYQRDSEWLPGKKGISLTVEQYSALIDAVPQIELLLQKQGEKVSRPKYDGSAPVEDDQPQEDEDTDKKANIEATSDEEE